MSQNGLKTAEPVSRAIHPLSSAANKEKRGSEKKEKKKEFLQKIRANA